MKNFMEGSSFGMPGMKQPDPLAFNHRVQDEEVPLPAFSDEQVDAAGLLVDPENVPWLRELPPLPPEPMQTAGAPKNIDLIDDEESVTRARQIEIEGKTRPRMESAKVPIGYPYRAGEGQRYMPDLQAGAPNDPSVISAEDWQVAGVSHFQRQPGTFFERPVQVKRGAAGLGSWPSVTLPGGMVISQESTAQNLLAQIKSNEETLRNLSPGAFSVVQTNTAAQRSIMETNYKKVTESPVAEVVASVAWQTAAKYYNDQLAATIKKVQGMQKEAQKAGLVRALPGAVKETLFSKYGIAVVVGGAAVVGLLFWLRSRQKK